MSYLMDGNNFNQRCVVNDEYEICKTIIGQGHAGNEPKVLIRIKKEKDERSSRHKTSNL